MIGVVVVWKALSAKYCTHCTFTSPHLFRTFFVSPHQGSLRTSSTNRKSVLLVGSILAFSGCLVGNMHGKNNVRSDEFRYSVTKSSEYSVDMNKATPGDTSNVSNKRKFDVDLLVHIIHLNSRPRLQTFQTIITHL
jgi:hypothetical protein